MIFTKLLKKQRSYDNIVIFELITLIHIPIMFFYLIRGYKINYFNINKKLEKIKWFKKKIKQIFILENIESYDRFINNEKALYQSTILYNKNSKMIKEIENLFDSKMIHIIYKKILIFNLRDIFNIKLTLNNIANKNNYTSIIFFPNDFNTINSKIDYRLENKVNISFLSYVFCYANEITKKLKYSCIILLMPIWIIIRINKIIPQEKCENYDIGMRIYNSDMSFYRKYRRIDFLLDNKKINKDNTLFCIESDISNDYKKKLKNKKYNTVELKNLLLEVDKTFMKNVLNITYLYRCLKVSILSYLDTSLFSKSSLLILHQYLVWKRFSNKYNIKNYVVYNDFSMINHVARNILLKQNGTKTWLYQQSCHFWDTFTPPNKNIKMLEIEFLYMYYDYLISWNNKSIRTFKKHNVFATCLNVGVLWSEHIKKISKGELQSSFINDIKENIKSKKIIGVLDTSFGLNPPLSAHDMVSFINGIFNLLNDNSDVFVLFKEKKSMDMILNYCPDTYKSKIKSSYKNLKSHERCYTTGSNFETSEIIAVSDIMISACFSSSTVESLGARKKGIYFDSSDNFRNYYYDKFPNLVAHGYEELNDLVHYWLYDITNEEFDEYLEKYVKGEIDAHVDGRAITRFRNMLVQ